MNHFKMKYVKILFLLNFKQFFSFREVVSKISEHSCSVNVENDATHMATFLTEKKTIYDVNPAARVKPSLYRINVLSTLIPW